MIMAACSDYFPFVGRIFSKMSHRRFVVCVEISLIWTLSFYDQTSLEKVITVQGPAVITTSKIKMLIISLYFINPKRLNIKPFFLSKVFT